MDFLQQELASARALLYVPQWCRVRVEEHCGSHLQSVRGMFKIVSGRAPKENHWNLDSVENDEAHSLEWLISRQTQRPQAAGTRTHWVQLLSCGCLTKLLSTGNQSKTLQVAAWWLLHSLSFPSPEENFPAWCNCFPLASAAGGITSFLTRSRLHIDSSDLCWSNWHQGLLHYWVVQEGSFYCYG